MNRRAGAGLRFSLTAHEEVVFHNLGGGGVLSRRRRGSELHSCEGAPAAMATTLDEKDAKAIVNRTMGELLDKFPNDSAEKSFERFSKLMEADARLREAFMFSGFSMITDQMYDELVRLGKRVPSGLKKPN